MFRILAATGIILAVALGSLPLVAIGHAVVRSASPFNPYRAIRYGLFLATLATSTFLLIWWRTELAPKMFAWLVLCPDNVADLGTAQLLLGGQTLNPLQKWDKTTAPTRDWSGGQWPYHFSAADLNDGCESVTEAMPRSPWKNSNSPKPRLLGFFPEEETIQEVGRQRIKMEKAAARHELQPYLANPNWGLF